MFTSIITRLKALASIINAQIKEELFSRGMTYD
jgi:hypothetical protein